VGQQHNLGKRISAADARRPADHGGAPAFQGPRSLCAGITARDVRKDQDAACGLSAERWCCGYVTTLRTGPPPSNNQSDVHKDVMLVTRDVPSPMKSRTPAILLTAALLGCASTSSQAVYVAPTTDNVTTETDEGRGGTQSHNIYVRNNSSVAIVVYGVTLRSCENVRQQCEPQVTNIRVEPNTRSVVLHVEPKSNFAPFSYRFSYSWRPLQK
jgi:hypothetical protein